MEEMLQTLPSKPHFGWSHYKVGNRELTWIAGGWDERRDESVRTWSRLEGGKKFLDISG